MINLANIFLVNTEYITMMNLITLANIFLKDWNIKRLQIKNYFIFYNDYKSRIVLYFITIIN